MLNLIIGEDRPVQASHDLVHRYQNVPVAFLQKLNRFYDRVDLTPLLGPVGPDFLRAFHKAAFERLGPSDIRSHESHRRVDVSRVKCSVGGAESVDMLGKKV